MKKNKKLWIVIILVSVGLIFGYVKLKSYISDLKDQMIANRSDTQDDETAIADVKSEIVFSGKVTPRYTQSIMLDPTLSVDQLVVEEDQNVSKGDTLLTYYGAENLNDLITIQENKFVAWQEDINWYEEKIADLQQELSWADPSDDAYVTSLKKSIADYQTRLATTRVNWNNAEDQITVLRNSYTDYTITADFDGFVYQIDDTAKATYTSPYIIIYSTERVVTVEVSEYELQYISEGDTAAITVESLDQDFTGTISKIAVMPNNITSSDTSYYNIEITIPDEIPYGYSVIISVGI